MANIFSTSKKNVISCSQISKKKKGSVLEYSTTIEKNKLASESYLDRIMWMCLFGFKVNRLALTISFSLVYPLLCAGLLSVEACYMPQHRSYHRAEKLTP